MGIEDYHLLFNDRMTINEKLNRLDEIQENNDENLVDCLILSLEKEEQLVVREKIVILLGELLDSENFEQLETMFSSFNAYVRNAAIEIMRADVSKYETIAKMFFHHSDKDIRKFALDVFGDTEKLRFLPFIVERLYDDDINICITAIEMLSKQQSGSSFSELVEDKLLSGDNVLLQCVALKYLSRCQSSPQYEKIIGNFRKNVSPVVLIPLTEYLISVGDEKAIDLILSFCKEGLYKDRMIALHAVKNLIGKLSSSSMRNKYYKELRNLPGVLNDDSIKMYINQILADYNEEDIESYSEFLLSEANNGNVEDIVAFIEWLGETGNRAEIVLLENFAESSEEDVVLESIGEAIVKIKERNGLPKK